MDRFFFTLLGLITILGMTATVATAARPMQVDDLFKFLRVSDAQISPDGFWIAYVVTKVDLDANKSSSNLWLADVAGKNPPKRLTSTDKKIGTPAGALMANESYLNPRAQARPNFGPSTLGAGKLGRLLTFPPKPPEQFGVQMAKI